MKNCDIIVPIYNAYDCVEACVNSVLKNTNLKENRLILIDDKSPDERIQVLLKKYKETYPEILFLSNEENLGFVKTVNKGMLQSSEHDVLLLNSDTEVTKNWLEKIKTCAYSSTNIATVTPLSNNATLASVPKPFEPNDLPDNYTLEEMADLVEKCSHNYYPEIPTGHGFCLYIKREVLDKVGLFDANSYGKGYGEENDFCFRCFEYGYRHILCDNTYILHKESKSFLNTKEPLIAEGLKILEEKYPDYKRKLDQWVFNRPIHYIAQNISLALGNKENHPNILFLIHDWQNIREHLGGTSLHAWDLIENMRSKYNFHIFVPENGVYKVYSYFKDTEIVIKYGAIKEEMTDLNFYSNSYKFMLSEIVENYNITFAHIHHMKGHFFDVVDVFTKHKIPYMITLHDFYSQCPLINKIYKNFQYCGNPSVQKCNECLLSIYRKPIEIETWRGEWEKLLQMAYKVITPSEATKKEILEKYSNLSIDVIEHGVNIKKSKSNLVLDEEFNDIAFIGAIGYHKGSHYLNDFVHYNRISKCKIHLFGISDNANLKSNDHFENHGRYTRDELKDLLRKNNIKLICLFSIWPETYSYTMTEAIASGIPVVSFSIGAIAERIKKYNLGWTIAFGSTPEEIAQEIEKILCNKKAYNKVIKSIQQYSIISTKEMAEKYDSLYQKYAVSRGELSKELETLMVKNNLFTPFSVTYPDYSWILNTPKWKIISKLKFPKPIKKLLNRRK